jgi:glycosyltransferase involved in cell wall biosynthesis
MKILLISNMWPGPRKPHFGIFVRDRVDAYRRNGAIVEVVATRDPRKGPWSILKYAGLLARSVWMGARHRPDVIEGHYLIPTAVIAGFVASVTRRPYVLYAHGSDVDGRLIGLDRAVNRAALLFTNSENTAQRIERRFGPGLEIVVIPPGVNTEPSADAIRRTDMPTVGFLGDLVPHKGADVLLDAVARMSTRPALLVAGDGPELKSLRSRADELDVDVEWVGAVHPDELPTFFSRIDVLAVPSRRDALGMVAVQALAAGVPVVVSRVGGLGSVPTEDCGQVVPHDEPDALAEALASWIGRREDPSVSVAARRRAADFDADRLARAALAALRRVSS